jgi:PadR family transcriptional regulator PadR
MQFCALDRLLFPAYLSSSLTMGRTEIPPGTLYMLILRSLDRLGPMHGYGIALHIQQMSDSVLQVEEGSLYPALQRMLIKGWVKAEWGLTENNRRARYYKLTPAGLKQLTQEVSEFTRVMEAITRVIEPA